MSEDEISSSAEFEVAMRLKPSFSAFILHVLKINQVVIIIGLCLTVWGLFEFNAYLIGFGLILGLSMPLLSIWNYRVVNAYDKLLRAFSCGRTAEALRQIEYLKPHMKQTEMAFDLDIRLASLNSTPDNIDEEIMKLEKWRSEFENTTPGMFESRVAGVYHHAGKYDEFVNLMRDAFFRSSQSSTLILDLVLAEARLGDLEKAEMLINKVKTEELPIHAEPFLNWAKGVIAFRKGTPNYEEKLAAAVTGFLNISESPAVWVSLAVCIGDYALYVRDDDSIRTAKELIKNVWDVLRYHGNNNHLALLLDKYPELKEI